MSLLDYPVSRKLILVEAHAGVHLYHWTAEGSPATWYTATSFWLVAVSENGIALTARASVAAVAANAGSFYLDRGAGRLYLRPLSGVPQSNTYLGLARFRWGNHARAATGGAYEPRLATAPDLSLRIPPLFTLGLTEGGGTVEVEQAQGSTPDAPGTFDGLDLDWSAGYVTVSAGAEPVY